MGASNQQHTLCWDCSRACGGCQWSDEFKPVRGWKAIKTQIKSHGEKNSGVRAKNIDSYIVLACPGFDRDAACGGQKWTGKKNQIVRRRKKKKP